MTTILRTWSSGVGTPASCNASSNSKRVEHAAHADVVGHAAVHEMDIGTLHAVNVRHDVPQLA